MNAHARSIAPEKGDKHRRSMIAKVHVARQQLAIDEDDYRQIILDESGQTSLAKCEDKQLELVIGRLKKLGFQPLPSKRSKGAAQHPMARKARAMWISLYQLGVVRNSGEEALEAFAKRQLKCDKLVWARQSDAYRLIEALKAMAERAGWRQNDDNGKRLPPYKLKIGLCRQILFRLQELQVVPIHWDLKTTAWRLCGERLPDPLTSTGEQGEAYSRLAEALGRKLREASPELNTAQDDAS